MYACKYRVATKFLWMRLCPLWIMCYIFSPRLSVTLLIWMCFRRGLFHSRVCQVSRQQVSSNKVVHKDVVLSKCENILTNSVDDGENVDLMRGEPPRSRDNSLCGTVKENISQLRPSVVGRPENGCQGLLKWFPAVSLKDAQNSMEKNWNLCGEFWGTYRLLGCIGTL